VTRSLSIVAALLVTSCLLPGCINRQRAERALGYQQLGLAYFDENKIPDAIAKFQESIKLNPHIAETHHLLANCYFAIDYYDDAEKEYQIATRLRTSYPDAYVNWGALLLVQERWEDAIDKFDQALEDPTYREAGRARHNKGWALYQLGRYDEARVCYQTVIKVTPMFCPSIYSLGGVAEAEGKLDEAEELYQRALSCNGTDLKIWLSLGKLYIRLDRLEDAIENLDFVRAHDEGGTLGNEAETLVEELLAGRSGN
jgi:Tfp pilus assembly protein PilF